MSKLNPFEWSVFSRLSALTDKSFVVAVSGGVDSVVLAVLLAKFARRLRSTMAVAHVHHGLTGEPVIDSFREQAQVWCEALSRKLEVPFHTNAAAPVESPQSEEQMRRCRFDRLLRYSADFLLLGHNADDLFETRLLRLMRGTDVEGLRAMELQSGSILRPLLFAKRKEIEAYALSQSLDWLEDPSNRDERYLRNFLRSTWIPLLEARAPGAAHRFAASLQGILERPTLPLDVRSPIELTEYMTLAHEEKTRRIALIFKHHGCRNYSRGQIHEVIKRLDSGPLGTTFMVGGLAWTTNAQRLSVTKVSKR